jgi:hypothetical protein
VYAGTRHGHDQCPGCGAHLGIPDAAELLRRVDASAAALVTALRQVADGQPSFTIDAQPLRRQLERTADVGGAERPAVIDRLRRRLAA